MHLPVTVEGRICNKRNRCQRLARCEQSLSNAPLCYKENNEMERICEAIVNDCWQKNVKQSPHLNQRLFVMPHNEFGVPKCVCSTLRPTLLPYPALYDSSDCSSFVAHFLEYEPLENPELPPQILPSPSQVLEWGIGDCFDLATVLASFLIGAGYNAFVVYGKAPGWICSRDRSNTQFVDNILTKKPEFEEIADLELVINSKDISSQNKASSPYWNSSDHLLKDCVHCWVLVRSNSRCPPGSADYFIEPSTGRHYQLLNCPYLNLFALWNPSNYWIRTTEKDEIDYAEVSLEEVDGWESMFLNRDKIGNQSKNSSECTSDRMPFDPPLSWVDHLSISETMFLFKYPKEGLRNLLYKKKKIELFSEGMEKQGIIKRTTSFKDELLMCPIEVVECFGRKTEDNLHLRVRCPQQHSFKETYLPKNKHSLKEWVEISGERRIITWCSKGRSDGLISSREIFGKEITYEFNDHRDRLARIHVVMIWVEEDKSKMKGRLLFPSGDGNNNVVVQSISETYTLPDQLCGDIPVLASRTLSLKEKTLETEFYHSTGGIVKGILVQRKGGKNTSSKDNSDGLLDRQKMINAETEMVQRVRALSIQCLDLVRTRRRREEVALRNEEYEIDSDPSKSKTPTEPKNRYEEGEARLDYLSPYMIFVQDIDNITKEEATRVYEHASCTLENRVLERANIIQNRLNEENESLAKCQASYQHGLLQTDGQSEQDFNQMCSRMTFRIKILERRLHEHEESSLGKLKMLQVKLKGDERLKALSEV